MGTDLHAPLGQDRDPDGRTPRRRFGWLVAGSAVIVAGGLSVLTMTGNPGLPPRDETVATVPTREPAPGEPTLAAADAPDPGLPTSTAQSGATVERVLTDDGQVVTKFTPKTRTGPVLIQAGTVGQDPRVAERPDPDLVEDSPYGTLPKIGDDGRRPFETYARPWSGARGTRVAIVVGGLGLSQTGTQNAIRELPSEITLGFAASGNSLTRWMQEARRDGHELVLQVPMEPFDYPDNDPGPATLLSTAAKKENLANLHRALGRVTNYAGVMNYLGGRFLSTGDALDPVMRDLSARGLMFLDDGSAAMSLSGRYAKALSMPHANADLQLDAEVSEAAVLKKLDELERIARRNGSAIGVAASFDEVVTAVARWSEEASGRGIEIVGVSALADNIDGASATAN